MTKMCSICKKELDISCFNKRRASKDGLTPLCKTCKKDKDFKYKESHYNEILERDRIRSRNVPKCVRKSRANKHYYKDILATRKYRKAYCKSNKDIIRSIQQTYRKANMDKYRSYARKRNALKYNLNEQYSSEDELYTRQLFNNCCACCGSTKELTIDHHYPLSKGNALTRQNAVLLCQSCNSQKQCKPPEEFYNSDVLEHIKNKLENPVHHCSAQGTGAVGMRDLPHERAETTTLTNL